MSTTIVLPPSTPVYVTAFTNAAFLQRITVTPPSGAPIVWTGTGENNNQIGQTYINTPGGTSTISYQVNAENSSNNGASWNQSSLLPGGCTVGTMNIKVVLSEDHVDQDFNDSVVQFLWWE